MTSAPRAGAHTESRFGRKYQLKSTGSVALHFRENATPHQTKSMTYATSTRANCRRWVREIVHVLEEEQSGYQSCRQRWLPRPEATDRTEASRQEVPIDLRRQTHRRMAKVDDFL